MNELEARALGELLQALETRVNRLQEALEIRIDLPIDSQGGCLSVSERLAALEDADLR
jgi:hypothetical protein